MSIVGLHHVTAICSDARRTVDFYTKILNLRLVKKTVNFDDPGVYHLYFGDDTGKPGTLITFFEWKRLSRGNYGVGTTQRISFAVDSYEALLKWKRWLIDHGVEIKGPYDRTYYRTIYFHDPDGLQLEIATSGPGWTVDEDPDNLGMQSITPHEGVLPSERREVSAAAINWQGSIKTFTPDMGIRRLHHITAISSNMERTATFYTEVLNFRVFKKTFSYDDLSIPHFYFGSEDGKPGSIVSYVEFAGQRNLRGKIGIGMVHHFAFGVENEDIQMEWRNTLLKNHIDVTPVQERLYFKSIYFHDPDGHILEIATLNPGFLVDEPADRLGKELQLPPWLSDRRNKLEKTLIPI
ncbi:MAG: VOC family protein [Bacteroidota bacterium]